MIKKVYILVTFFAFIGILKVRATDPKSLKDYLVPKPKDLNISQGEFTHNSGRIIAYGIAKNRGLRFSARYLQDILAKKGMNFFIAGNIAYGESPRIELIINPEKVRKVQGYHLEVSDQHISITAHDEAGLYYGVLTFGQVLEYSVGKGGGSRLGNI
ncbi:hypothetical protein HCG49_13210 [Arenibacter sp. 6A1]|uniref:glycoside hydrolase family 20 zincin-like fold domain-containing protein n=1 Tax=Arenibacter sp. 6A1 TaxID=2720391 RepID=UPI00144680D7|nr:glycoside hydrolase family 20 zincin-like fold domain-containing protein [Arenibacter sp. 6A1]NKI27522.1 hypothetical protein [Arenibacter sp. 6A1]